MFLFVEDGIIKRESAFFHDVDHQKNDRIQDVASVPLRRIGKVLKFGSQSERSGPKIKIQEHYDSCCHSHKTKRIDKRVEV